jgi:subfamily B ATP-binding cassette protein MsbA
LKPKFRLFPKFDPRLRAELNGQRRLIRIGMFCVLVSALLEYPVLRLMEASINTIKDAAPISLSDKETERLKLEELDTKSAKLAEKLHVDPRALNDILVNDWRNNVQSSNQRLAAEVTGQLRTDYKSTLEAVAHEAATPVGNRDAVNRLGLYSLFIVGIFALKYWFTRGQAYYLSKAAARLATDLRVRLFKKLQRLPVSYFNEKRAGGIYSVLTNDVNVYQNAVQVVRDSIDGPLRAAVALFYIVYTEWQLALVAVLFLPPMALVIQRNGRKMKRAQLQVQGDLGDLGAMTNEALLGTRVIRAFAAEGRIERTYSGLVERSYASQVSAIRRLSSLRPLVELIGAVALASVLYICGWMSFMGIIQLGQIAALIYALDRINQGFKSIGSVTNTYSMVEAASHHIHEEVLDVPEPIDTDAGRTIDHPKGQIEFRDVSFSYPDGTEALSHVSFTIEPGTSLALVGPSGAGKSTIADLVLRFYEPTGGKILLDGVDIAELKPSWLRNQIGVVPQQTFLFAGSVSDNIRLGKDDASEEDIIEASRAAHAEEFVSTMDGGYNSELGESGIRLSGGQRQRIAIARALVRKPTVLLLDEATSALDPASEKIVTEALDEIMRSRTTLFIAHRLTTAARADRILVLRRGEAVELGSHKQLIEKGGVYAGLFAAFSGGVLD